MINTTVENIIRYEVRAKGAEVILFQTESRLKAYDYYYKASERYGEAFTIQKVTINTEVEILEGEK